MNKTEINLSQQDKNLLEKAKKETRANLIVWITSTIFMFVMFVLVYTIQLPLDETGIIVLFFLLILILPTYAIIKIYGFYKTINDALLSNKKLIIEAETYTDFPMNSDQ